MIITVNHYIRILTGQAANPPSFTVLNLKFMRMFDVGIQLPMHHSYHALVCITLGLCCDCTVRKLLSTVKPVLNGPCIKWNLS